MKPHPGKLMARFNIIHIFDTDHPMRNHLRTEKHCFFISVVSTKVTHVPLLQKFSNYSGYNAVWNASYTTV